jgi:hypothetical protein
MKNDEMMALNLSIAFSLFGMLLIFGLGFVFPEINPYVVIKWIIIVCTVVFAYALLAFLVMKFKVVKAKLGKGKK